MAVEKAPIMLVVIASDEPRLVGRKFVVDDEELTIGSDASCDVVIRGELVSPVHARVCATEGGWQMVLHSGELLLELNHRALDQRANLRDGDRISVATTTLSVIITEDDLEERYHSEIYRLTTTDGLTGALNARGLHGAIERLMAKRHPCTLALFRLEGFNAERQVHAMIRDRLIRRLATNLASENPNGRICRLSKNTLGLLEERRAERDMRGCAADVERFGAHVEVVDGESLNMSLVSGAAAWSGANIPANALIDAARSGLNQGPEPPEFA